jgi:hypothetical protein
VLSGGRRRAGLVAAVLIGSALMVGLPTSGFSDAGVPRGGTPIQALVSTGIADRVIRRPGACGWTCYAPLGAATYP